MDDRRKEENEPMRTAIHSVAEERTFQRAKFEEQDNVKSPEEWLALLNEYMWKVARETPTCKGPLYNREKLRGRLVQLGALTVAALEKL